jgi:hypothetical protein
VPDDKDLMPRNEQWLTALDQRRATIYNSDRRRGDFAGRDSAE